MSNIFEDVGNAAVAQRFDENKLNLEILAVKGVPDRFKELISEAYRTSNITPEELPIMIERFKELAMAQDMHLIILAENAQAELLAWLYAHNSINASLVAGFKTQRQIYVDETPQVVRNKQSENQVVQQ